MKLVGCSCSWMRWRFDFTLTFQFSEFRYTLRRSLLQVWAENWQDSTCYFLSQSVSFLIVLLMVMVGCWRSIYFLSIFLNLILWSSQLMQLPSWRELLYFLFQNWVRKAFVRVESYDEGKTSQFLLDFYRLLFMRDIKYSMETDFAKLLPSYN